jgi:hypothetical protein
VDARREYDARIVVIVAATRVPASRTERRLDRRFLLGGDRRLGAAEDVQW